MRIIQILLTFSEVLGTRNFFLHMPSVLISGISSCRLKILNSEMLTGENQDISPHPLVQSALTSPYIASYAAKPKAHSTWKMEPECRHIKV